MTQDNNEAASAILSAVPPASPTKVPGLGTITDEDNGVLTLEFKDEDSAQAFMHSYSPTVEITEMPSRAVPPAKVEGVSDTERLDLLLSVSGFRFEIIDQQFYLLDGRGRTAGKGATKRAAIDSVLAQQAKKGA